jgi:hypothetical protein
MPLPVRLQYPVALHNGGVVVTIQPALQFRSPNILGCGSHPLEAFDHPVNADQITCYRTASGHVPDDLGATNSAERLPILSR